MTRAVGRAVAAGLLGALAAVVWLALFYGLRPALTVDLRASLPRLLSGIYPGERDPVSGGTFAWTGEQVTLRLPGLDRRVPWQVRLRVRGGRQAASDNPTLTFSADGLALESIATTTAFQEVTVTIPVQPDRRGLTLGIRSSATVVPGGSDPRALGVILERVQLAPTGIVVPPRAAFAGAAGPRQPCGAGVAMLGVTAGSAIGAAILLAAAIARTVAVGFGPYTDYPLLAARTGLILGTVLVLGALIVRISGASTFRNTARFAVIASAAALLVKLLVLLHPDMPVGDALFHAHRFQQVLDGNLYFTSIAPGNYLFPYAPGLYVLASGVARLVPLGYGDMALLRVIAAAADAAAGTLLYAAVVRWRGDRLAGACAVALYALSPLTFGALAVGNLTNAFAQALSVVALGMMSATPLHARRARHDAALHNRGDGGVPLAHQQLRDPVGRVCDRRDPVLVARWPRAPRRRSGASRSRCSSHSPSPSRSTTPTSATPTGRSCRASARRPWRRLPTPAAGASSAGCRRCRGICGPISVCRSWC